MSDKYNKDYYENGIIKGLSCYENYRWIPELTYPMAHAISNVLKLDKKHKVLEFGCAHGYLVKALNDFNIETYGVDISDYAISNGPSEIKDKMALLKDNNIENAIKELNVNFKFDYVIAKDVFEHIEPAELKKILRDMSKITKNLFVVVPLGDDGKYRIDSYALDKTHVIAENEDWWINLFTNNNFKVKSFSHNIEGIKDKWIPINEQGNAFFILNAN